MLIKKFNESVNSNDDIIVKVIFSNEINIPLEILKKTEYYKENYDESANLDDYISTYFYSVEEHIYNDGVTPYKIKFFNKNGDEIENVQEYEKLLNNTKKYNL